MSTKKLTVHRLVATAFATAVMSITLALATAGQSQTVSAAAMAKCIPGTGNPLNPCPSS